MSDRGHAAVELALAVGVLLLPVALAVIGFAPWSERRVEAEAVAAEAARTAVLELSHDAGVSTAMANATAYGIPPHLVRIGWCGAEPAPTPAGSCSFQRGAVVSVTVQLWTPLVATPWGAIGGLWVTGEHSEPIDLYRSLG
ncbi:MAG TPA: hypothetical protein VMP13_09350 [Acidimicrobiia bacterium]|nr:hypothetical protein [Acidimicrobiia bacterium]